VTVHLVYPHAPGPAAPGVIGRRLHEYLAKHMDVRLHDWDQLGAVRPAEGDVLIGHPHPLPGTVFRSSFRRPGWARRIVLCPYNGDLRQVAFLDPFVRRADHFLAITGRWWAEEVVRGPLAHWTPVMSPLDLAVDRDDFPMVKTAFAPAGRRRVLYVGHSGWQKNPGYLSQIARARPDWEFGWVGRGAAGDIPGFKAHGVVATASDEARRLVASYDIFLTVGAADANPMTVLEAMAWGLLPVCTPQSGYVGEPGVFNVPLDDLSGALAVLDRWQAAPEDDLVAAQRSNARRLADHYTWDRFGDRVLEAINGQPLAAGPVDAARRARLRAIALTSPLAPWRTEGRRLTLAVARRRRRGPVR
jgi:glycosyltransferase involved in cell wall biosynthesis